MNDEETITMTILLKKEKVENELFRIVTFPMNDEEFENLERELFKNKKSSYSIEKIENNACMNTCDIEMNLCLKWESIRLKNFSKLDILNNLVKKFNFLSNKSEILALETYTSPLVYSLLKKIKEGQYHFYKTDTKDKKIAMQYIGNILQSKYEELYWLFNRDEEEIEKTLVNFGYFITNTGVLYIQSVPLYTQVKAKYDEEKKQSINKNESE